MIDNGENFIFIFQDLRKLITFACRKSLSSFIFNSLDLAMNIRKRPCRWITYDHGRRICRMRGKDNYYQAFGTNNIQGKLTQCSTINFKEKNNKIQMEA